MCKFQPQKGFSVRQSTVSKTNRRSSRILVFLVFIVFLLSFLVDYYYMMIIIWNSLYNYVVSVDFYICSICLLKCLYFTVSEPYCLFLYTLTDSLACSFQLAFFLFLFTPSFLEHSRSFISFIYFIRSLVRSFVRSFIPIFIHSSVHPFFRSFILLNMLSSFFVSVFFSFVFSFFHVFFLFCHPFKGTPFMIHSFVLIHDYPSAYLHYCFSFWLQLMFFFLFLCIHVANYVGSLHGRDQLAGVIRTRASTVGRKLRWQSNSSNPKATRIGYGTRCGQTALPPRSSRYPSICLWHFGRHLFC